MWVVKIGGSWLKNPKLPSLINFLQKFANQKIVLVVGGGVFAETVRNVYKSNMTFFKNRLNIFYYVFIRNKVFNLMFYA